MYVDIAVASFTHDKATAKFRRDSRMEERPASRHVSVCADFAGDDHIRRSPSDVGVEQVAFFARNSDFALGKFTLGAQEALVLLREENEASAYVYPP